MSRNRSPRWMLLAGSLAVAAVCSQAFVSGAASAAAPYPQAPQATLTVPVAPGSQTVRYSGTAPFNNGQTGLVYGQLGIADPTHSCEPTGPSQLNDQHVIKLVVPNVPARYDSLIRFQINWTPLASGTAAGESAADMQLWVYGPDGKLVDVSDGSQDSEGVNLTAAVPGEYDVLACQFQGPPQGQPYDATVTATTVVSRKALSARGVAAPTYAEYVAPAGLATRSGEPSIGNSWKSGHTLFTSNTKTYDVAFNDRAKSSTWTAVNTAPNASNRISLDPIGYTDSKTGRSFTSQLLVACSGAVYSDDEYKTTTPSQGCGSGVNGGDHQTYGGGPFPEGVRPLPTSSYPDAVYYCAQSPLLVVGVGETCARSDDGGLTFGSPVQIFGNQCNGITGHVRVGPDGAVYVPDNKCDSHQAVIVSTDGGATWNVRPIPDSFPGQNDPSVSVGSDGTVYFGYADGTGKPKVAVSRDHGRTWSPSVDVGAVGDVHNTEFSEVAAGDGDRAAYAFLGTPTRGSDQADSFGKSSDRKTFTGGSWHMYVATTYDRGAHWTVVDATPKDPVQRGCVWNNGGGNPCRNLLDFNDITLDKTGHVLVGFAKGCTAACVSSTAVSDNKLLAIGAIIRQQSGKGLFKAYDAKNVLAPVAVKPTRPTPRTSAPTPKATNHTLATTGLAVIPAILGGLLLGGGLLLRRRSPGR